MARPNNAFAIAGHVQGLREAKAAFQALPAITRDALANATFATTSEIARIAQQRLRSNPSIRTRTLHDAIGFQMNWKSGRGRAGIKNVTTTLRVNGRKVKVKGRIVAGRNGSASTAQGAKRIRPSQYGHLVEFGGRSGKMPAEPFMIPAAESQKGPYLDRCKHAGKAIEQRMSAIGRRLV